jgi:hypothetical protein
VTREEKEEQKKLQEWRRKKGGLYKLGFEKRTRLCE